MVISADPALTPTVQCTDCSTLLNLGSPLSPGDQNAPAASTYMDYQCPGCGATNSADPVATPEVHCNTCLTPIKLGHAQPQPQPQPQPQEAQNALAPASNSIPSPDSSSSIPELGAASGMTASEPARVADGGIPELGAARDKLPELGSAVKKGLPELGAATKKELPELGAALKKDLPAATSPAENPLPEQGTAVEKELTETSEAPEQEKAELNPVPETTDSPVSETASEKDESGAEEVSIQLPDEDQREVREKPAWLKFLLQVRVLVVILGVSPVMITVIVGAILVFIRSGTGIASGDGDMLIQVGQIVLGLVSLWAMYILGMTFYFADRDWVTDFGHFVMIGGAIWGMYAVVINFPSGFFAILAYLFYAYVCLAAIALAVWLLAPYKGIGNPR